MPPFSTILLIHTLRALLADIEQTPNIAQNPQALVDLRSTLLQQIARLEPASAPSSMGGRMSIQPDHDLLQSLRDMRDKIEHDPSQRSDSLQHLYDLIVHRIAAIEAAQESAHHGCLLVS